jgi:CheY-like chemotaxis protein
MEGKQKTVLIVDDQPDERTIQGAMLDHLGYRVCEAASGPEGLESAAELLPDLVLLDVAMPNMDGFTVCRELRADPRTQAVRIVLFTASVAVGLRESAEACGADGVLVKPVDPRAVAAEVHRLIGPPRG